MPLEATQHTPDGAKAFAAFFIKTIDWGYATMSSKYMRHYYEDNCRGCMAFSETIDHDERAGNRYVGGRLTIRSASVALPATSTVVVEGTSRVVLNRKGKFVRGDPGYPRLKLVVTSSWNNARHAWTVTKVGVQP